MADTEKKIKSSYGGDDIEVLEGLEGVRKRPAMYIGSTNSTGLHHLVWEIVDNSIDEAISGFGNKIYVNIHKDGSITVTDEGRGIPCGMNTKYKRPAVDLVFSTLHAGGKFSNKNYTSSAGLHGVGSAVTNGLSEWLDATIQRDGKIYHIRYEHGGRLVTPLEIIGESKKTGTSVTFKPDPKIFSSTEFKFETISERLKESAFLLKDVHIYVRDERHNVSVEHYFKDGIKEFIGELCSSKNTIGPVIYFEDKNSDIKIECALQYASQDYDEHIYSYANNVRTKEGGTHESGFRIGLTKCINSFASENDLLKKVKLEGSDIREGLTAIISLRIPESKLEYEGQTKGKLGTPEAQALVSNFIETKLTYFLNENKSFALDLIKKCIDAASARLAARKAKEEARGQKKPKVDIILSDKLTPAQSKDYLHNELFIVEGESAGGSARKGRDRIHQAILPLRGKPLNTDSVTLDRMLKNEEFATIINTIGAGVGPSFIPSDSHYGKIIIMTDADTDGAHIQTLLLTFFFNYMRPLITSGMVYVAKPPLYRVYNDKKEQYAWNDDDLEEAKKKIGSGYKISRYKGLGEMDATQLYDTTMDPKKRVLVQVQINDQFVVEQNINILMGKDTNLRKQWLEQNVDFTEHDDFINKVK